MLSCLLVLSFEHYWLLNKTNKQTNKQTIKCQLPLVGNETIFREHGTKPTRLSLAGPNILSPAVYSSPGEDAHTQRGKYREHPSYPVETPQSMTTAFMSRL